MGKRYPLPSDSGVWESVMSSLCGVQSGTPAENSFIPSFTVLFNLLRSSLLTADSSKFFTPHPEKWGHGTTQSKKWGYVNYAYVVDRHVARRAPKLPFCLQTNLFDNFFLTSFATNIPPKCHKWGYKPKKILLAPIAALFCTPIIAMVS